mgnify:CR=1 FL=1
MPDYKTYDEQSALCAAKLALAEAARHEADVFKGIAQTCADNNDPDGEAQNLLAAINQLQLATNYALEAKAALEAAAAALGG